MSVRRPPTGVILAGGASRRMGADKALVQIDGRPMIVGVADALWEAGCDTVFCQGGDESLAEVLGVEVRLDPNPGAGPVAAVLAALEHDRGPIVVAACDLADLDRAAVSTVIEAGSDASQPLVVVACTDSGSHLLSFWSSQALEPLRGLVADGVAAYRTALERLGAVAVSVDPAAVRNINLPEDLG